MADFPEVLGDPAYGELHKFPKWNRLVTVLDEPRLMRRVMPFAAMSSEEHRQRAEDFARKAGEFLDRHAALVDEALAKYGDHGSLISGVIRDHFPDDVKDQLRYFAHGGSYLADASVAHHLASGARKPWRNTPLRDMVYGARGVHAAAERGPADEADFEEQEFFQGPDTGYAKVATVGMRDLDDGRVEVVSVSVDVDDPDLGDRYPDDLAVEIEEMKDRLRGQFVGWVQRDTETVMEAVRRRLEGYGASEGGVAEARSGEHGPVRTFWTLSGHDAGPFESEEEAQAERQRLIVEGARRQGISEAEFEEGMGFPGQSFLEPRSVEREIWVTNAEPGYDYTGYNFQIGTEGQLRIMALDPTRTQFQVSRYRSGMRFAAPYDSEEHRYFSTIRG